MIYRELKTSEYNLLEDFLYEAIYIPEGADPPDRDIVKQPALSLYYEDFGSGKADHCIVAEDSGKVIDDNDEEYIMICSLQELTD